MDCLKIMQALENAKDEINKGVTANFELELLQIAFDDFADCFEALTGEKLNRENLLEYYAIFREKIFPDEVETL